MTEASASAGPLPASYGPEVSCYVENNINLNNVIYLFERSQNNNYRSTLT